MTKDDVLDIIDRISSGQGTSDDWAWVDAVANVTQSVTSVDPDSDDPKNVGTKPETKAKRSFKSPEEQEKNTFP